MCVFVCIYVHIYVYVYIYVDTYAHVYIIYIDDYFSSFCLPILIQGIIIFVSLFNGTSTFLDYSMPNPCF